MKPTPIRTALALALGHTEEQIRNLAILALFHHKEQRRVRMCSYVEGDQTSPSEAHTCNTAACILGWAPAAGIRPKGYPTWEDYCHDSFGLLSFCSVWSFLFSTTRPDSATLGARRIAWYLEGHPCTSLTPEPPKSWIPNWSIIEQLAEPLS